MSMHVCVQQCFLLGDYINRLYMTVVIDCFVNASIAELHQLSLLLQPATAALTLLGHHTYASVTFHFYHNTILLFRDL